MEKELVIHIISGLEDAGAEGALYRLVTNDVSVRHLVISLQGDGKYGPKLRQAGIEVECLELTSWKVCTKFALLTRRLRDLDPAAVQTWMYEADVFGGLAALAAGISNVHWSLRFSTVDLDGVPKWMRRSIKVSPALSHRIPKSIICCGERVRDQHVAMGYCPDRMAVVWNGFDLQRLKFDQEKRARLRAQLGVEEGGVLLGPVPGHGRAQASFSCSARRKRC